MLEAAQKAASGSSLEFLAVSVLTSWDKKDLDHIGINNSVNDQVKLLINLLKLTLSCNCFAQER